MGFLERTVDILERISGDDLVDREFALLVQADKLGDKRLRDRIALAGAHDGTHIHQHVGTNIELVDNSARSKRQYSSVELRGEEFIAGRSVLSTAPAPVWIPQPIGATSARSTSASTFTALF